MPGDRPEERRAAQPSGRPHEPSGDRRPEMDDHHRMALRRRSVQNSAYRPRSLTHPIFRARNGPRYYCPGAQAVAHRLPNVWDGTVLDGELTAGRFEAA